MEERLQRRIAGYAPESVSALLDWVKERLLIPEAEWDELCEAIRSHPDLKWNPIQEGIAQKVVAIALPNATQTAVVALENLPRLFKAMDDSIDTADFRRVDDPTQKIEIDWVRLQNRIAEPFNSTITARVSPDRSEEDESPFEDWLSQWLTFYGPISPSRIHDVLGVEASKIENALESLLEEERIVRGHLRKGNSEEEICDRENYERLLRLLHKESTPLFTPLPAERLPFFLAHQQGLTQRGESLEDLQRALESLLGYPSSAELWEREWLPARMRHYHPRWMDELTREAGLIWYGCGEEDITLCFQDQIDCFQREETVEDSSAATFDPTQAWFPDRRGKYDFAQLMETSHLTSDVLTERLWSAVWKGKVSNDAFSTLRKGIESRFKAWKIPDGSMYSGLAPEKRSRGRTSGFGRWKASRPFAGNWFLIEPPHPSDNALDALEREKDGVRLLLDRYGIVFRDLLQREMPALRWGILFKALWLMELSGEIAGGYFFEGIPGVQFARMHSLKSISTELHDKPVYWMNATDPASLCGLAIEGLKGELPARRPTTHLVYHGTKLVLVSYRQGKELDFRVSSDHPDLLSYLGLFGDWLGRNFQPMKSITIETINQEEAVKSLFLPPLRELYHVTLDYKKAILRKRYS